MEKDRYQVIKNVIDFDFTSFYPTTAIYSNISPDTLSREKPEISHNVIDITY
jgi:DNA polymerase elongation subunit (family B)